MRYKKKKMNKNWECKIEVRGLKKLKKEQIRKMEIIKRKEKKDRE